MNIIEVISQDIFDKVRSRFTNLEMGNEEGAVTSDPKEARFFDFDFVIEGHNLGRVSISINERGTLKIFYSQGITEGTDTVTRGLWYDFLKEMRYFAKRRMMRFDTRDITKGNLNKNDFQFLSLNGSKDISTMNESSMYGSSKTSYRKLENTRLVIRHSNPVDEGQAGARSRHISALFIETSEGERFKYPYNHLAGAKAMQRHVANGGIPHDGPGQAIIHMSEQIAQLNSFKRHVKTGQLNDDANQIHQRAGQKLEQLRDCMSRLQGQNYYENWRESYTPVGELADLDEVTIEDYKNKFTVKQFDETLASVFPLIHSIMQETGTIDLEDLVSETTEEFVEEDRSIASGFEAFENWANSMTEGVMAPEQVEQFKELISTGLTLGPDATSAIEALNGIGIEDESLENALKSLAAIDPQADPLETIEAWLKVNDPDVLTQLGGAQEEPAAAPAPAEEPAPEVGGEIPSPEEEPVAEAEDMKNTEQKLEDPTPSLKELAEFIGAFYNPHAREQGLGEWRKGPTELGIMAGKQFGDRAGKIVELLVTRMQDSHQGDQQFAEVMRLAGIAVPEGAKEKEPEGLYSKKRFEKDSDRVARLAKEKRQAEKKKEQGVGEKFDPLKHVKNPTPGEKKAAKDVKRGSYADRAAMLKSAEADGRLKNESQQSASQGNEMLEFYARLKATTLAK